MFTKLLSVALLALLIPVAATADSIEDELKRTEMERSAAANANMRLLMPSQSSGSKKADDIDPVSLKLFRGRSDGWWQAIIKMSNGARIAVSGEFATIYGDWTVIGTKGNSVFVQKSSDKKTIRQLFVDVQDEGVKSSSTTSPQMMPVASLPPPAF